jgi:LysR family glycine cleavage system transcriptional activator
MRRLPPIPECVAFEAVATHRSFTRAAETLCLSQSAISHRVRRLENFLGKQLIYRLNPGIELTHEGLALLPELTTALDALGRLGKDEERRLRVVAPIPLCQLWLAGRLADFMAEHPGLSVDLIPRNARDDSLNDIDLWIGWTDSKGFNKDNASPLFSEAVFPVCSPTLLPDGKPLANVQDLVNLPLLHKVGQTTGEWSWSLWFDYLQISPPQKSQAELRFADMGLLVSAAINGSGVALARSLLAYDALKAGTLVVPITGFDTMRSTKKHYARWPANRQDDPDVDAFKQWLTTQAAQTLAETEDLI